MERTIGVLLMAIPELWLCWLVVRALNARSAVTVDVAAFVVAGVSWMAGRVVVGEGLLTLALAAMGF